jgi:hypothetical protein
MTISQAELDAINADIAASALKPQSATVDGNSVNQLSISDKIKAAQYAASQVATGNGNFGLRFVKLVPPGCG